MTNSRISGIIQGTLEELLRTQAPLARGCLSRSKRSIQNGRYSLQSLLADLLQQLGPHLGFVQQPQFTKYPGGVTPRVGAAKQVQQNI